MQLARSAVLVFVIFLTTGRVSAQGDVFNSGPPGTGNCQNARKAENARLARARAEIARERTELGSQREREMIGCRGEQPCFDRVAEKYGERERQLQVKDETEIARHAKAMSEIDAGRCSGRTPAAPSQGTRPLPRPDRRETGAPAGGRLPPGDSGSGVQATEVVTPERRTLLFKLGAEMDVIAQEQQQNRDPGSEFVGGMAEWARDQITFLAQEPGAPVRQMAQGIIDYLLNDNSKNHQALKKAASIAVDEFRQNPARFIGKNLPNLLPGPGEVMSGTKALRTLSQVENAAGRLKGVAQAEKAFGNSYNQILNDAQDFGQGSNKCFANNACVPTALAEADMFKTGGPFGDGTRVRIQGVQSPDGVPGKDLRHTPRQIIERLQSYGENYQPRHPNSFSPAELSNIQKGIPVPVTGSDHIARILEQEGIGSQGLVFVRYQPLPGQTGPLGHAFNAQHDHRGIQFIDHTQPGHPLFTAPLVKEWFFYPIQ